MKIIMYWYMYTINNNIPPYSMGFPSRKNLMVGYPRTSNFSATDDSTVASTLPSLISEPSSASCVAAFSYSGAKALQCPHHGASERNKAFVGQFVFFAKWAPIQAWPKPWIGMYQYGSFHTYMYCIKQYYYICFTMYTACAEVSHCI